MTPTLSATCSDDELSAAVAEYVLNRSLHRNKRAYYVENYGWASIPQFSLSADEVLPLLEKCKGWRCHEHDYNPKLRTVEAEVACDDREGYFYVHGSAPTFARAACFALLRSKGVVIAE